MQNLLGIHFGHWKSLHRIFFGNILSLLKREPFSPKLVQKHSSSKFRSQLRPQYAFLAGEDPPGFNCMSFRRVGHHACKVTAFWSMGTIEDLRKEERRSSKAYAKRLSPMGNRTGNDDYEPISRELKASGICNWISHRRWRGLEWNQLAKSVGFLKKKIASILA